MREFNGERFDRYIAFKILVTIIIASRTSFTLAISRRFALRLDYYF